MLKFIDVDSVGIWQFGMLIQGYVIVSRMGILNSFNREYVVLLSAKKNEEAEKILQTTYCHIVFSMVVQATTFLCIGFYFFFQQDHFWYGITMLSMILFTVFEAGANFEEAKSRSLLKFDRISTGKIIVSIASILFLLLPFYFGFKGMLLRYILLQVIIIIYFKSVDKNLVKLKFSLIHWKVLFNDGWKFWLFSYIKSFLKTTPRLYLVLFTNITILGLFTPVNWVLLSFTMFTSSLTTYLYPLLSEQFVKGEKRMQFQSLAINTIAFLVGIPFAIVGYLLLPYVIIKFLPEYISCITVMRKIIIASLFDIITISSTIWYSMKSWKNLAIFYTFSAILTAISFGLVYLSGHDNILENVGNAILISSILCALLILVQIFINEHYDKKKATILSV